MDRGGAATPPEEMQHDQRVRSAASDPRIYHGRHLLPIFVLFPAPESGSKKGSLLPSQVLADALCSGRPSYLHASLVEEPSLRRKQTNLRKGRFLLCPVLSLGQGRDCIPFLR
ncbi:hypothetical protein HPP92_006946 [Vanilla planifolia]|uniref:Uncharacterized protein n=1 Tax=Vanilla planifolia TaxID=51239 RepID=A0A835RPW0_VANPL|nr:hypothetical protein HPP92_007181 [Vanilla planifolia]KAG0490083.1 hypothetical protein HPP92_006946 [Vanilla planifolia]